MRDGDRALVEVDGKRLEVAWHGPGPAEAATLVFLHEGLGSVSTWRDFPAQLAARVGAGALVYSRAGYGRSDASDLPLPVDYMHREAAALPRLLAACGVDRYGLVGHSDGASIAILHASRAPSGLVGVALEAPHVFVEDLSVASIAAAKNAYEEGDLRAKLARHHERVDVAFRGWNDVWLSPAFRGWNIEAALASVTAPVLVVQGADDEYGTLAQVDSITEQSGGRVTRLVLAGARHAPHKDRPAETLDAMASFFGALRP